MKQPAGLRELEALVAERAAGGAPSSQGWLEAAQRSFPQRRPLRMARYARWRPARDQELLGHQLVVPSKSDTTASAAAGSQFRHSEWRSKRFSAAATRFTRDRPASLRFSFPRETARPARRSIVRGKRRPRHRPGELLQRDHFLSPRRRGVSHTASPVHVWPGGSAGVGIPHAAPVAAVSAASSCLCREDSRHVPPNGDTGGSWSFGKNARSPVEKGRGASPTRQLIGVPFEDLQPRRVFPLHRQRKRNQFRHRSSFRAGSLDGPPRFSVIASGHPLWP